jgi:hypothetical protein
MKLRQTLEYAVDNPLQWDGGKKQVFDWRIEGTPKTDNKGKFIRIGCFGANHWFCVALGKTEKLTLANAKRHLRKFTSINCTFEYIN